MPKIDRFTQLNCITDVWEPKYSTDEVLIACWKVDRSKLDIKLRFPRVNETSEYYGDWFITHKKAKSYRKRFDNNGVNCYVIPWEAFEPLELNDKSIYLI